MTNLSLHEFTRGCTQRSILLPFRTCTPLTYFLIVSELDIIIKQMRCMWEHRIHGLWKLSVSSLA